MMIKGYKQEDGLISLHIPTGDYLVDGKPLTVESYNGETVIATEDVIIKRVHTARKPATYTNTETGSVISAAEYDRTRIQMRHDGTDVDGEWFDAIQRLQFEMYCALHQPTYVSVTDTEDVTIDIVGAAPHNHACS